MAIEKRHTQKHGQGALGQGAHGHGEAETRTDFEAVLDHVRDNPLIYVATLVFTIVAVIAGFVYLSVSEATRKEQATVYLQALLIDDEAERAAALAQASANLRGDLSAEALYMAGETAYRAGTLDDARRFFERVRSEHAGSSWTAPALEGLGYILEQEGDAEGAMALYREVQNSHAYAFEARRQWYNLGRAAEKMDDIEGAIGHYSEQITAFPGSTVAQQAQAALDRLRRDHPALFPDDLAPDAPVETGVLPVAPVDVIDALPAIELDLSDETPDSATDESIDTESGDDEAAADAPEPVELEGEVDDEVDEEAAAEQAGE